MFNKWTPLPIFETQVNLMYGSERAPLLLEGQKVVPKKVLDSGYQFQYPTLDVALKEIVGSWGGLSQWACEMKKKVTG